MRYRWERVGSLGSFQTVDDTGTTTADIWLNPNLHPAPEPVLDAMVRAMNRPPSNAPTSTQLPEAEPMQCTMCRQDDAVTGGFCRGCLLEHQDGD